MVKILIVIAFLMSIPIFLIGLIVTIDMVRHHIQLKRSLL